MIIGIVGKANVGKSTFFKAATLAEVEIANYPFTTIKKNEGVGFVSLDCVDRDFNVQCQPNHGYCLQGKRFVPVKLIDVAGLVPGASSGKGLGNQFLDDLREADCLLHIVDASGSSDENGEPLPPGSRNPVEDVLFLEAELDAWYLNIFKKVWKSFITKAKQEKIEASKAIAKQFSGLKVSEQLVKQVIKELSLSEDLATWTEQDLASFASALRKASKPMLIVANKADVSIAKQNIEELKSRFEYKVIPCSAEAELALKEAAKKELISYVPGAGDFKVLKPEGLSNEQLKALEFIKDKVLKIYGNTGVQQALNTAVFELLKYIAVFPVANAKLQDNNGKVLPDCFLVPENTTALQLAFKIHTDLGENFIKAIDVKTGRVLGKDSVLQHRSVIEIVVKK